MKYNNELGLYVAGKESLEDFCQKLIYKQVLTGRQVIGEFNDTYIYVSATDTVKSLVQKYQQEQEREKKNPMKKHTKNNLTKNASGYSDPTAYKAIMNVDREMKKQQYMKEHRNEYRANESSDR